MTEAKSAQPQFCPQCGNSRDNPREDSIDRMLVCADPFHSQSAQPQLPPLDDCPRCKGSGQVESISFVNSSKRVTRGCNLCHGTGKLPRDLETLERQLLSALAENESLKAQLAAMTEDRDLWQQAHDEDCPNLATVETLKAERDKALEVIREYRQLHSKELGCFGGFNELSSVLYADKRCPTCIKADELRKVKEEEIGE